MSTTYSDAYARLNTEQKEAVDTIEGPVMVIAGPGTGKTQILTLRIARILEKTDTKPENILALTFTESGARAMQERLATYIGAPAYRVAIHTFHEFAGSCIRLYPEAYRRAMSGRPMTDLEKIVCIRSILETPEIRLLRPRSSPEIHIASIRSIISSMKREFITPDHLASHISHEEKILKDTPQFHEKGAHKGKKRSEYLDREKSVGKNKELLFVYRVYESYLEKEGRFDYDDMIFETVYALERDENMLRSLQEQYHYILADEHQDVNGSQNRILELLASFHESPNIFVVGDEKQSIYRFQGASLENFLFFEDTYSNAKTIALTQNYRSTQSILDLSHDLIKVDEEPFSLLRVPLMSTTNELGSIEYRSCSHEAVEHDYLVRSIETLIKEGVPREEIVVIVRKNKEVEAVASLLRKAGIPADASADGDILEHPITFTIRTLMRAVVHPHDEEALFEVLNSGYSGLSLPGFVSITQKRSRERTLVQTIEDADVLSELTESDREAVRKILSVLTECRDRLSYEAPHRVLEFLIREIGFLEYVMSRDPYGGGRVLRRLYDEVEGMVGRKEATTFYHIETLFSTYIAHGVQLTAPFIHTGGKTIAVMTAHKAKGLEFTHVFVPHLTDTAWGGKTRSPFFNIPFTKKLKEDPSLPDDDEKKLLYVAFTRAKRHLYLSYAQTSTEGKTLIPTRLLESVRENTHLKPYDVSLYEDSFDPAKVIAQKEILTSPLNISFLQDTLIHRGMSATALNNYLEDPWLYFYRNVLRIPELQSESAQFGTAVHDTLWSIMKYRREEKKMPSVSLIRTYLERELNKFPFTNEEFVRHHTYGFEVLTTYLDHVMPLLPPETKEEVKMEALLKTGDVNIPEIRLTGMLDRLDFDESGKLLRVVDYKSGKVRTRGQIEGTTKDSNGNYKRQLVFYALILSLQDDERLHSREGVISFVEPDEKGYVREETFHITDDEIEFLKKNIVTAVQEIARGEFLRTSCDPELPYAHLVSELQEKFPVESN